MLRLTKSSRVTAVHAAETLTSLGVNLLDVGSMPSPAVPPTATVTPATSTATVTAAATSTTTITNTANCSQENAGETDLDRSQGNLNGNGPWHGSSPRPGSGRDDPPLRIGGRRVGGRRSEVGGRSQVGWAEWSESHHQAK